MTEKKSGVLRRTIQWLIGPAVVMTAGIMGAGSTVSLLSSGNYFQYSLLWAVLLSLPAIITAQDTASRIGSAADIGMMQLIDRETVKGLKWVIIIPVLLIAISANMGQLGAMASALTNFINLAAGKMLVSSSPSTGVNMLLFLPLMLLVILANITGGYKRIEKLMFYLLFVVLFSFLIVAVQAFLHAREILLIIQGFVPRLPPDLIGRAADGTPVVRSSLVFAAAIIGGGVASTAILSYPYFTREGGYDRTNIKLAFRKHLITYGVLFGIYSLVLMVAGGYALYGQPGYAGFQGAQEMGMALKGVLGPFGTIFFSLGLFICGFNTMTVISQLCSYFVLDALNKNWRFSKDNTLFRIPFLTFIILPALISSFWRYPNMLKVVIAMVINTIVTPLTMVLLIYLANKKSLMGEFKASPLRNVFLAYTMALALFTGFIAVKGLWSQFSNIFF
jgi:manganese transport protein